MITVAMLPTSVGVKIIACNKRSAGMIEKFSSTNTLLYLPRLVFICHADTQTGNSPPILASPSFRFLKFSSLRFLTFPSFRIFKLSHLQVFKSSGFPVWRDGGGRREDGGDKARKGGGEEGRRGGGEKETSFSGLF